MNRGRGAKSPWQIPFLGWLDIGWRVFKKISLNRIGLVAAGIAFYALLALFPSITAAVALVGVAFDASILLDSSGWLLAALPAAVAEIITQQITEVSTADAETLGFAAILALLVAFWSASKGVGSFVDGLNVIYEEHEDRGFIKLKLITFLLTIGMIAGLALSVLLVAAIPTALAFFGNSEFWKTTTLLIRWPLMFALGVGGIAILYRFAPSRRDAKWHWVSPGAVLACLFWVVATLGFSFYVQSFGTYNETFGALGGVVILLTWLWISAFVVLLGAQVDAEIEAQTKRDSTVGPDRPIGERGAVKADTLGESLSDDA